MSALLQNGEVWSKIAVINITEASTEIVLPDLDLNNFAYLLVGSVKALSNTTAYDLKLVVNGDDTNANYLRFISGISNGAAQNQENNGTVSSRDLLPMAASQPDTILSLFLLITRDANNKITFQGQRRVMSSDYTTTRSLANFSIETKVEVTVNPCPVKIVSDLASMIAAGSKLTLWGLSL